MPSGHKGRETRRATGWRRAARILRATPRWLAGEARTVVGAGALPPGLRALVVSRTLPGAGTSGELLRNRNNIWALSQLGTVRVIAVNGRLPARPPDLRTDGWHALGTRGEAAFVPAAHGSAFALARPPAPLLRWRVQRAVAVFRPHCIIVEGANLAAFVAPLGARAAFVVLDEHNVEVILQRQLGRDEVDLAALAEAEAAAVRNASAVWACSEEDAERLDGEFGVVATPIPNVLDIESYASVRATPRPERPVLAFAGLLSYEPNRLAVRELSERIFPAVRQVEGGAQLLLLGEGSPSLAGIPGILTPGRVPDVRPWLGQASVVALPLRAGSGTRLKAIEALAAGRPLVSTARGVEGLGLADGEHYLRAETAGDFVAAILALQRDPECARRLVAAGLAYARDRLSLPALADAVRSWSEALPTGEGFAAHGGRPARGTGGRREEGEHPEDA